MISFLYNVGLNLFEVFLNPYGFFRKGIKEWNFLRTKQLQNLNIQTGRKVIWIHCASLGEYEQVKPLLILLKKDNRYYLFLTFFSPSGYLHSQTEDVVDGVSYLPIDTKKNMQTLVAKVNPSIFIGVKYEFWWNLLHELHITGVKIIYLNVRLNKNVYFLHRPFSRFTDTLKGFHRIFTLNPKTFNLLKKHGFDNLSHSGDTRIESVLHKKKLCLVDPKFLKWKGDKKVFVWGSVYLDELDLIHQVISEGGEEIGHVITPHHADDYTIDEFSNRIKLPHCFSLNENLNEKIVIVNEIGKLFSLYSLADFVYVGGALNRNGLHNIFEPLVFEIPICLGPNYQNFPEAISMIDEGFAVSVTNTNEVVKYIERCGIENERNTIKKGLEHYFSENRGVVSKIYSELINATL